MLNFRATVSRMRNFHPFPAICVAFLAGLVVIGGCTGSGGTDGENFVRLQGAGATFPAPLYMQWFRTYSDEHDNVQVDYQSVGSGQGVTSVIDGTVDFGASDAAMSEEEIAKVEKGVQLLPMTAGSIVLAYNLEGVENLKLSREAYVDIFLGKVTKWNDPAIVATNEGVELPEQDINVVVRSDGSGTTYVFAQHLSEISSEFKEKVGVDKAPNWPVGTKSKGNEGVTTTIHQNPGSIGYIEYGFAKGANLETAALENKAGNFIEPSIETFQAALSAVEMPENLVAWLPDPEGEQAYPIVTYTWIIAYKTYDSEKKVQVLKDLLRWCLTEGQKSSEELGYIPLPESVAQQVTAAVDKISVAN